MIFMTPPPKFSNYVTMPSLSKCFQNHVPHSLHDLTGKAWRGKVHNTNLQLRRWAGFQVS